MRSDAQQTAEKQFLSVDFVTALTYEECADRLGCCDDALNQVVALTEDGSFSLRRTISDSGAEVKFWGTLEQRDRGTWVWGTIFEDREDGVGFQPWIPAFAVIVMLFLALEAMLRGATNEVAAWLIVLVGLAALAIWRWRRRYRHGLKLVEWVYETLYVPPPHAAPQQPESQQHGEPQT